MFVYTMYTYMYTVLACVIGPSSFLEWIDMGDLVSVTYFDPFFVYIIISYMYSVHVHVRTMY